MTKITLRHWKRNKERGDCPLLGVLDLILSNGYHDGTDLQIQYSSHGNFNLIVQIIRKKTIKFKRK